MAERTHRQRSRESEVEDPPVAEDSVSPASDRADLDDLLDEIDEVLESNAEEFVRSYVQKGGE
jgi:ubiquitin-like protein Pup